MVLFASDLDRTIIFSNKFLNEEVFEEHQPVCIEYYQDRPISFVTQKSYNYLLEMLSNKDNNKIFVPTTTRSLKQFNRIRVLSDFPYAIVANGGIILKNKKPLKEWESKVKKIQEKLNYKLTEEILNHQKYTELFTKQPKLVDSIFFYMKVPDSQEQINYILTEIEKDFKNTNWTFTLQGLKLYIIPKEISKENAIDFLINYLHKEKDFVVTSGDGKLDRGMIEYGTISFIPTNSELYNLISEELKKQNRDRIEIRLDNNVDYTKIMRYNFTQEGISSPEGILNLYLNF